MFKLKKMWLVRVETYLSIYKYMEQEEKKSLQLECNIIDTLAFC